MIVSRVVGGNSEGSAKVNSKKMDQENSFFFLLV